MATKYLFPFLRVSARVNFTYKVNFFQEIASRERGQGDAE